MRVVIFVHHFPPDVNSTGRLMSRIASGLRDAGHELVIVTTFPHYEGFRIWQSYRRKLVQHEMASGIEIWRVWCFARGNKSMRRRLLNYLTFNLMATVVGLWVAPRSDVVLATNGSFFTGITAWVSGLGRVPFVYNVQDLYPEVPILAGQLQSPRIIRILRRIANKMYSKAAHISVIAPTLGQYLCEHNLVAKEKISVVPNFVDTETIRPLPRVNRYAERMGMVDRFVIAHSGNIGYAYDLMTLLESAKILSHEDHLLFAITGSGVLKESLMQRASSLGLRNVQFLPFQPEDDLPWLRASTDVQLALYVPGAARYSMPSKVYEIMASGRPVLASAEANSDVHRLIEESGGGVCIDPGDAGKLAETIMEFHDDPRKGSTMGALGRRHIEERYSAGRVVTQYEGLLAKIAGRPHTK